MSKGLRILGCIVVGALIFVAVGFVTMFLWNWLVPTLFNGPAITFWQTMGLLLLCKILFQGLGKGYWKGHDGEHSHWKGKGFDKFSNMSPEEKEAFKKKMREKWCSRDHNNAESRSEGIKE